MTRSSFEDLLRHGAEPKFNYIDPPFNYNSPGVSQYPVEVSGRYLLNILCLRLGWPSLAGKRLLDFGCGVRFARTIINLGMDIGLYAGVDVKTRRGGTDLCHSARMRRAGGSLVLYCVH
jgi:hypothetical protein